MKKPNFLFLFSDQHNPKMTGYSGNTIVETPNLDALAAESINFDSCYCQNPLCVPSRASLITGQYNRTLGIYDNRHIIPSNFPTFPRVLSQAGYRTCLIGKSHFNGEQMQGYSQRPYGDFFGQAHQPNEKRSENDGSGLGDVLDASGPLRFPLAMSQTEICVSESAKWLQTHVGTHGDMPFLLSVHFDKPHFPMTPPEKYYNKYKDKVEPHEIPEGYWDNATPFFRHSVEANGAYNFYGKNKEVHKRAIAAYFGCIEWVDDAVGRIIDVLKYLDQLENTVIIYSSDHGEMMSKFGAWQKSLFFDDSCRVPMLMRVPGQTARINNTPVGLIDVFPTLCDLAGINIPEHCEGLSLKPIIDGGEIQRDYIYAESSVYKAPQYAGCMIRTRRYKYALYLDGVQELYDLTNDPEEENNIINNPELAGIVAQFHEQALDFWRPEEHMKRFETTPMMQFDKHHYRYSNQFMLGDGTIVDARP